MFTPSLENVRIVSGEMNGFCVLWSVMGKLLGKETWSGSSARGTRPSLGKPGSAMHSNVCSAPSDGPRAGAALEGDSTSRR